MGTSCGGPSGSTVPCATRVGVVFNLGVEVLAPAGATDVRMVQQDLRALYVSVVFGL